MEEKQSQEKYGAARAVMHIITAFGWIAVIAGLFIAIGLAQSVRYGSGLASIVAALPGVAIAITGLFSVGFAQVGGAVLDNSVANQVTAEFFAMLAEKRKAERTAEQPESAMPTSKEPNEGSDVAQEANASEARKQTRPAVSATRDPVTG